jgi:glycosyltransferase involved in cell wall biosynthesis
LPNGVDCDHYARISDSVESGHWPRPVFGYTGTIHGDRFDVDLVAGLARSFSGGSIVLVGPDHLTPAEKEKLAPLKNVHLTGPVSYSQIPESMAQFDVCIVPHVETNFTNSLNPLKLWEYLASGKPVVSTNVSGFRSYSQFCRIASGLNAFVEACRDALGENGAHRADRRAEAAKHSWNQRIDLLLATLSTEGLIGSI